MNNLKGKNVLVTGASNGIGKAIAIKYAKMGANLILIARNETHLIELKKLAETEYGVKSHVIVADVREYATLKEKIENIPDDLKRVDILVNNAGLAIGLDKLYLNQREDVDNVLDTNVKGAIYMLELIVPKMLENGVKGKIINMGSVAGNSAYAGGAVYCASKAAIKTISDGLRIDLVDKDIRVTTILPGMVETDFSLVRFKGDSARAKSVYTGIEPLTPEDVADTVIYVSNLPHNIQITDLVLTPLHQADGRCLHKSPDLNK